MAKWIIIGILVLSGIGIFMVYPYLCLGLLVTAFCVWRHWFIAAVIAFLLGICLQVTKGENQLGDGGSYTDYSSWDEDDRDEGPFQDFETFAITKTIVDKANEKNKDKK